MLQRRLAMLGLATANSRRHSSANQMTVRSCRRCYDSGRKGRSQPATLSTWCLASAREVDEELAAEIREFRSPTDGETRMFYEIVIAPSYSEAGLAKLRGKSKTLRILEAPPRAPSGRSLRQVGGEACAPMTAKGCW